MPQSLQSLLMAKNSSALNMVACTHRTLNEASTYDNFDTQPYDGQLLSLSDLDEKELDGSSEMVYDSSISSDGTTLELSFEGQMDTSSKFESKCEHITDSIVVGNMVDSSSYDQANVLRIENENKDLKIQIQQNLGKISSFEKRATEFASMRDELDQKTAELNGMRINFAEIKKANEASYQKLLADNLSLRTAQTDSVTSNYIAEKKCASLEVMRVDLIQQIKNLEENMQEISDNGRKSYENLAAAERQISHLNSENIQLRKLRDELDSASLKSAHQLRQINTLESELSNLRGENKLLRQKKSNVMGNTDETDYRGIYDTHPQPLPSTSFSLEKPLTSLSPRPPPSRSEKERNLHNLSEVEVYPRPPPYPSDDAIIYQQQQPMAYGSKASKFLAAYTASGSAEMKVPHGDTNYGNHSGHHNGSSSSDSQKNWDQDSQRKHRMSAPAAASLTVRSLADLIGNRRSTVGDNWSRNTSEDNYYSLDSDFPSSSGAHENNRNKWNTENLPGNEGNIQNSSKTAASHSSLSTSSRMTSDSRTDGRKNNSGGGVSSFYDDSNDPVVRAPFGTALSASENMVSFADTEKKLTSLMTEKSVLYEESARLQQRGGKILKDRARLQHVDARLVEIGKEIAVERKKLSGKPG